LTIKVTGKMWSWTYEYPDYGNFSFDAPMLSNNAAEKARELHPPGTDNHIVVPAGKTVRIVTIGTNLIYSCAIPSIGAGITALPGRTNQSWFKAAKEGRYYGECSELCGLPHAFKPIEVEVVSPERFDQWVAEARWRLAAER
jgi:cytochrome c oxidase subunit 2